MSNVYTVGQYLADRLHQIGVDHLFAIPGDYCAEWVHNYVETNPDIERIGATNELNAGYAADGYARMRGVGAVCVTYSVGAFSLLNAIAGAYVERVPVVVINGAPSPAKRLQFRETGFQWHHLIDDQDTDLRVYQNVTVAAERIEDPDRAPKQIDAALAACLSERRPVYLETLENVYDLPCERPQGRITASDPRSDAHNLEEALEHVRGKLVAADRPLVWAGVEIERYGLQDAFAEWVEAHDLPYVTSLLGKGVLSESNARFAGIFDGNGSPDAVQALVKESDFVLGLGAWMTDENLLGWMLDWTDTTLAYREVVRAGAEVYTAVSLPDLLHGLLDADDAIGPFNGAALAEATRSKTTVDTPDDPDAPTGPDETLTYQGFYDAVSQYVDASTVVMGGTGFNYFGSMSLPTLRQSGYVAQAAYADIGYVTPAAVGVDFAVDDDVRVMVFAGDGGFQMTAQCIGTMVEHNQNPILFVLDNGVYGIEQWLADPAVYGNDEPFYPLSVIPRWNYSALPHAFGGGKGWRVETFGELTDAVQGALDNTDGPSLIQVVIPSKSIPEGAEFKVKAAEHPALSAANP